MLRRIWGCQTLVDWTLRLGPFDGPVAETGRLQMKAFSGVLMSRDCLLASEHAGLSSRPWAAGTLVAR